MRKSTNTHSIRFYLVGFLQNDHIRIQCAAKDFPPTKTVVRTLITRKLFNPNFLNKHFFLWTTRRIISVVDAGLMKIGINFRNEKRYNFICLQFVHLHRVESSEYQMQIFILFSNEKKVLIISHHAENRFEIEHQSFSVTFSQFFLLLQPFYFSFATQTHSVLCAVILCRRSVCLNYV